METNVLYYGDNLDILRRYIPDESIDLVYLHPPFNSNRDYNVVLTDESGRKSDAQLLGVRGHVALGPSGRAPGVGRLLGWWNERKFEREWQADQQQWDAKSNQELSESYGA